MTRARLHGLVGPAYLGLCLVIGGSAQSVLANCVLQLAGLAVIAWAALRGPVEPMPVHARRLAVLVLLAIGLVIIQLVPMPPMIWTHLPGRQTLASGFTLLGLALPWQPISMTPYDTIATALTMIPALAMLALVVVMRAYSRFGLAMATLGAASAGIILGVLQVGSTEPQNSPFYFQKIANFGTATGFFANQNHMATLLLCSLALLAATTASKITRRTRRNEARSTSSALVLAGVMALLLLVGLALNRSLAGYILSIPAVLLSLALLFAPPRKVLVAGFGAGAVALALAFVVLSGPAGERLLGGDSVSSFATRKAFAATSLSVIRDHAPVGTGFGSFATVYRQYESTDSLDTTAYVNHAHDDYLELLVEGGVPALLLMVMFLIWWSAAMVDMWRTPAADSYAKSGAIVTILVLAHSLVDFPLRTAAIAALFATGLGLMLVSRLSSRRERDLRETRHLELG